MVQANGLKRTKIKTDISYHLLHLEDFFNNRTFYRSSSTPKILHPQKQEVHKIPSGGKPTNRRLNGSGRGSAPHLSIIVSRKRRLLEKTFF